MARKIGERDPALDTDPTNTIQGIIKHIPKLIRTDYGGKNKKLAIADRLNKANINSTPETIRAYELGASNTRDTIKKLVTPRIKYLKKLFG